MSLLDALGVELEQRRAQLRAQLRADMKAHISQVVNETDTRAHSDRRIRRPQLEKEQQRMWPFDYCCCCRIVLLPPLGDDVADTRAELTVDYIVD